MVAQLAPVRPSLLLAPLTRPAPCPTCHAPMFVERTKRYRKCLRCHPAESPSSYVEVAILERSNNDARTFHSDAFGAEAQLMIVEYLLCGVTRLQLSERYGWGARKVQAAVSGTAWRAYGQPIIDRLAALGIERGRGRRTGDALRLAQIAVAQRNVLQQLLRDPADPDALVDARILTAGQRS